MSLFKLEKYDTFQSLPCAWSASFRGLHVHFVSESLSTDQAHDPEVLNFNIFWSFPHCVVFVADSEVNGSAVTEDMKVHGTVSEPDVSAPTPTSERKPSKFAALGRLFKPWKWKRRKKPSENIHKKAVGECVRYLYRFTPVFILLGFIQSWASRIKTCDLSIFKCMRLCMFCMLLSVSMWVEYMYVKTFHDRVFSSSVGSSSRMFCVPNITLHRIYRWRGWET